MTKVQIRFRLQKPLDEPMMERIARAQSLDGIVRVKLEPSLEGLTVDYDASRVKRGEVQALLEGTGLPVEPL